MSDDAREDELRERIIAALRTVHDPEIPVNVFDLGLIYELSFGSAEPGSALNAGASEPRSVRIRMTLTAPNCPVADSIVGNVVRAVRGVEGVSEAEAELVWDPPWHTDMMSEIAQIELEAMGIDPRRPKPPGAGGLTNLTIGRRPGGR